MFVRTLKISSVHQISLTSVSPPPVHDTFIHFQNFNSCSSGKININIKDPINSNISELLY